MKELLFALLVLVAAGHTGCATTFYDSAPASDGGLYVVGSELHPWVGPVATAWRCPSEPGRGACKKIRISQ